MHIHQPKTLSNPHNRGDQTGAGFTPSALFHRHVVKEGLLNVFVKIDAVLFLCKSVPFPVEGF